MPQNKPHKNTKHRRESGQPSHWDQYVELLDRKKVPEKARRWYVTRVEAFLSQVKPESLQKLSSTRLWPFWPWSRFQLSRRVLPSPTGCRRSRTAVEALSLGRVAETRRDAAILRCRCQLREHPLPILAGNYDPVVANRRLDVIGVGPNRAAHERQQIGEGCLRFEVPRRGTG